MLYYLFIILIWKYVYCILEYAYWAWATHSNLNATSCSSPFSLTLVTVMWSGAVIFQEWCREKSIVTSSSCCNPSHRSGPWGAVLLCSLACSVWVERLGFSFSPIPWDHPAAPCHPLLCCLAKKPCSPSSWAWWHRQNYLVSCSLCSHLPCVQRAVENRDKRGCWEGIQLILAARGRMNSFESIPYLQTGPHPQVTVFQALLFWPWSLWQLYEGANMLCI